MSKRIGIDALWTIDAIWTPPAKANTNLPAAVQIAAKMMDGGPSLEPRRLDKVEADIREIRSLITTIQAQIRALTPATPSRPPISSVGIVKGRGPTQNVPPSQVRRIIK